MPLELSLPGSLYHQTLLKMIVALYENRDDLLSVYVFGSLGRGTWDDYSDLDLAVVVQDDVQIDSSVEAERVRARFDAQGEPLLFSEMDDDECFFVLQSLVCIAIRYHKLAATNAYVLDGCRVLCGRLDVEAIRQAARANEHTKLALSQELHRSLWLALGVDTALQRRQFWPGLQGLQRMQTTLLGIFATSRGGKRVHQFFEVEASTKMKALFGPTLPHYSPDSTVSSLRSLGDALMALLDLLEHHLAELSNDQSYLGPGESEVIAQLRAREQVRRVEFS